MPTPPRDDQDHEPDVNQLAHALVQRMTGEVPITPEDRVPRKAADDSTEDLAAPKSESHTPTA